MVSRSDMNSSRIFDGVCDTVFTRRRVLCDSGVADKVIACYNFTPELSPFRMQDVGCKVLFLCHGYGLEAVGRDLGDTSDLSTAEAA